jgi:hypothetical protein
MLDHCMHDDRVIGGIETERFLQRSRTVVDRGSLECRGEIGVLVDSGQVRVALAGQSEEKPPRAAAELENSRIPAGKKWCALSDKPLCLDVLEKIKKRTLSRRDRMETVVLGIIRRKFGQRRRRTKKDEPTCVATKQVGEDLETVFEIRDLCVKDRCGPAAGWTLSRDQRSYPSL